MRYSSKFNLKWLEEPQFKDWLLPDPESKDRFRCKICRVSLLFANEGRQALVKHSKGKKHIKKTFNIAEEPSSIEFERVDSAEGNTSLFSRTSSLVISCQVSKFENLFPRIITMLYNQLNHQECSGFYFKSV